MEPEGFTPVGIGCPFEPVVDFDATVDLTSPFELGVADTVCSFGRVVDSDLAADGFPMGEDAPVPVPWCLSRSD